MMVVLNWSPKIWTPKEISVVTHTLPELKRTGIDYLSVLMAILAAIFETVKFVVVQLSSYKFLDLKVQKKFPVRAD